jgi:hypothetical protein
MPPVGFEPTISVLEQAKTVRALNRAATAIGILYFDDISLADKPVNTGSGRDTQRLTPLYSIAQRQVSLPEIRAPS